jgi:hypothetical protein
MKPTCNTPTHQRQQYQECGKRVSWILEILRYCGFGRFWHNKQNKTNECNLHSNVILLLLLLVLEFIFLKTNIIIIIVMEFFYHNCVGLKILYVLTLYKLHNLEITMYFHMSLLS